MLKAVLNERARQRMEFYRYEEPITELQDKLIKSFGYNMLTYIHRLFQKRQYKTVCTVHRDLLNATFDWSEKLDTLLLFAESAKQAAAQSENSERDYRKYRTMSLQAGGMAFKQMLNRHHGAPPETYDPDFCKAFNAYWNYLDGFGLLIQAKELENKYASYCPAGGGQ